jgi:hypothetical protein
MLTRAPGSTTLHAPKLTIAPHRRDMVYSRRATAFTAWNSVHGLFLNNATQRAVYALQELHSQTVCSRAISLWGIFAAILSI